MKNINITLTDVKDLEFLVEKLYSKLGKEVKVEFTHGYDGFESLTIREIEPEIVRDLDIGV